MFELTIPSNFTEVTDLTVLSASGVSSANYFFTGDEIAISDKVFSYLRSSATETDSDGKPAMKPVYYALVNIRSENSDKGYDKLLPLAAFRRKPRDTQAFLANASDLMRQLAGMPTDRERFEHLKGKTIKVLRLEDGEALDYQKTDFASKSLVYKPAKFAVFDIL